jgi:ribosomal protein S18 acetylase RimI-like enzyme
VGSGEVAGYVLGCLDTLAFNRQCHATYWPQLREVQYHPSSKRFAALGSEDRALYQAEIVSPLFLEAGASDNSSNSSDSSGSCETETETETADGGITREGYLRICLQFPSHLHIDLLPQCQGKGYGAVMIRTLLAALKAQGSEGVHLQMSAHNARAYAFYLKLGFSRVFQGAEKWILGKKLN